METTKKYLIALSDGHGILTYGKRSPILPNGMKSETGNFMHENEFNRSVINKLDKHLQRCGFDILLVAPTDADTPLTVRTNLANSKKADIYVSVHANAFDAEFNERDPQGIETFHYPNSIQGKKLAEIIHKHLIQGTKQVDRGVKAENFHEVRETNMPSVLIEAEFMDNLDGVKLLLSDSFRGECAVEIAKGICEYFGVKYIEIPIKNQLYRVRKSWDNPKSQIGAFANLETAKIISDKNNGFNVYDESGRLVYPIKPNRVNTNVKHTKY